MNQFVSDVENGKHIENGWPNWNYGVSKLGLIAYTKILAREENNILCNACCPGSCATDFSSHYGPKTAEEGARTVTKTALVSEVTGEFYEDEAIAVW